MLEHLSAITLHILTPIILIYYNKSYNDYISYGLIYGNHHWVSEIGVFIIAIIYSLSQSAADERK